MLNKYINGTRKKIVATTLAVTFAFSNSLTLIPPVTSYATGTTNAAIQAAFTEYEEIKEAARLEYEQNLISYSEYEAKCDEALSKLEKLIEASENETTDLDSAKSELKDNATELAKAAAAGDEDSMKLALAKVNESNTEIQLAATADKLAKAAASGNEETIKDLVSEVTVAAQAENEADEALLAITANTNASLAEYIEAETEYFDADAEWWDILAEYAEWDAEYAEAESEWWDAETKLHSTAPEHKDETRAKKEAAILKQYAVMAKKEDDDWTKMNDALVNRLESMEKLEETRANFVDAEWWDAAIAKLEGAWAKNAEVNSEWWDAANAKLDDAKWLEAAITKLKEAWSKNEEARAKYNEAQIRLEEAYAKNAESRAKKEADTFANQAADQAIQEFFDKQDAFFAEKAEAQVNDEAVWALD